MLRPTTIRAIRPAMPVTGWPVVSSRKPVPEIIARDTAAVAASSVRSCWNEASRSDLAVELLARGLSVRDIEDAFRDETGRLLLSRTAVSQISERLRRRVLDPALRRLQPPGA